MGMIGHGMQVASEQAFNLCATQQEVRAWRAVREQFVGLVWMHVRVQGVSRGMFLTRGAQANGRGCRLHCCCMHGVRREGLARAGRILSIPFGMASLLQHVAAAFLRFCTADIQHDAKDNWDKSLYETVAPWQAGP